MNPMNPSNVTASWNSSSWLGVQQQTSLKKTIQAYKCLSRRLKTKLEQLSQKREELRSKAFVMVHQIPIQSSAEVDDATPTLTSPNLQKLDVQLPQTRMEVDDYHYGDLSSLVATVTNILIESVEIRLSYVMEAIQFLTVLYNENSKQHTPAHLMLSRYEEWVETNQRLFELNSRLYDLEKIKFDRQRRDNTDQGSLRQASREEFRGSQLVQSNAMKIESFLSRHQFPDHALSTTQAYLQEVLTQRGDRVTLEAQKVREYVNECLQNSKVDLDNVTGAHPDSYQQFMAILCNFMVERQREVQGVHLSHSMVYSTVEHVIVPQIQNVLLRYVEKPDQDARIKEQCEKFSNITMQQLDIRPAYWSPELEPFMESIALLRATYFSPTPTDKMSGVVAAAKALYDQLSTLGSDSIDGDSFLDLWIYVTIKANLPDLATNVEFMCQYGNPVLAMDEAGYYLTTLSVAANFIEMKLQQQILAKPNHPERFVVCEREKFRQLSVAVGSCFQVESEREELQGYKVTVIKTWVLNKARLFCSVLLHTGDPGDIAVVSVIRLSSERSTPANVEYFSKKLTKPQLDLKGLTTQTTPLGQVVTLDLENINKSHYFMLDGGDFDQCKLQITHNIQLIRLGSESTEQSCDLHEDGTHKAEHKDKGFVYVFTPPQENLEESFRHHKLIQYSETGGRDPDKSLDQTSSMKRRSKSESGSPSPPPTDPTSGSFVSHSPYLLSYSQQGVGVVDPPTDLPPDSKEEISQDTKRGGWGFSKLKTSGDSRDSLDPQQPLGDIPPLNITEPTDQPERDHTLASSLGQRKKRSGYQELNDTYQLSVVSDLGPENAEPCPKVDQFARSDNFSGKDSVVPMDGSASPTLKRLSNSLRARFKRQTPKKSSPTHYRTTLALPELFSPEKHSEGRSKLRSRTSAAEERSVKPRERGRGSFVVVKIKEPGPEEFLNGVYVRKMEENFRINHLFGSLIVDVDEGMGNIIRQGQMYLQHLNFLSVAVPIDGVFSDVTLTAVRKFQESHNKHESSFSSSLLLDGHLTSVTFQYLRQAFLTLYASMFRLGLFCELAEGFDPTSTREEDVKTLRSCVSLFQESYGLLCSHGGLLCQHTIAIISKRLTEHHHSNRMNSAV